MSSKVIRLHQARQERAMAAAPVVSADDFSVKVACVGDPMFWIRIELPVGKEIHVTDFKRGSQSRDMLAEGLIAALEVTGIRRPARLRFSNIAPMGPSDPQFSFRLTEAIEDIRVAADAVAQRGGTTVRSLDAKPRGNKVGAEATFATL